MDVLTSFFPVSFIWDGSMRGTWSMSTYRGQRATWNIGSHFPSCWRQDLSCLLIYIHQASWSTGFQLSSCVTFHLPVEAQWFYHPDDSTTQMILLPYLVPHGFWVPRRRSLGLYSKPCITEPYLPICMISFWSLVLLIYLGLQELYLTRVSRVDTLVLFLVLKESLTVFPNLVQV